MLTLGEIYGWLDGLDDPPEDHPQDDLWLMDDNGRVYPLGSAGEIVISADLAGGRDSDYVYAEYNIITGQCTLKFTPIKSSLCIKGYEIIDGHMILKGNPKIV